MSTPTTVNGIDELKALIGQTIGPSDWREVTQEDIDKFADVSGDHQWIHVDVERAKTESPFGTTIAHGNLTLCLCDSFRDQLFKAESGFKMGINYGWNKVRYTAPVPSGARIRASLETLSVDEKGDGWYQLEQKWTVEIEGQEKPALLRSRRKAARLAPPRGPILGGVATEAPDRITEQRRALPNGPGVYLFRDAKGKVLYVGKARSLRKRVASHFSKPGGRGATDMIATIADIDFIATETEAEALLAEQEFIKRHRPVYNVRLRDDKSYPYIGISMDEDFPRIYFTRERHRKNRVYFGPFSNAKRVRETLDLLGKVFMYRTCDGPQPGRARAAPASTTTSSAARRPAWATSRRRSTARTSRRSSTSSRAATATSRRASTRG